MKILVALIFAVLLGTNALSAECSDYSFQEAKDALVELKIPSSDSIAIEDHTVIIALLEAIKKESGDLPFDISEINKVLIVKLPENQQVNIGVFKDDCILTVGHFTMAFFNSIYKEASDI